MSNPQLEDGYLRIANEIVDALCRTRIPGEARQVLDVILRKTYGYGKKEDAIALSQFHAQTLLKKANICRAIKKLATMNIIIQKDNDVAKIYAVNKDFSTWKPLSKRIIVIKKDNLRYQKRVPQKTILQKTINIGDDQIGKFTPPTVEQVGEYCRARGNGIDPESFVNYYESRGWIIGKSKMKNWQAAVRTWEQRRKAELPQKTRHQEFYDLLSPFALKLGKWVTLFDDLAKFINNPDEWPETDLVKDAMANESFWVYLRKNYDQATANS